MSEISDDTDDNNNDKEPFHISDDSDKDPTYSIENEKANERRKNIPDYFGLNRKRSQQPPCTSSASKISKSLSLHSEPDIDDEQSVLFDGTFYTIIKRGPDFSITAQCQICLPIVKYIKGRSNATTNFLKHLKTKHRAEHQKYLETKKIKPNRKKTKFNSSNSSQNIISTRQLDIKACLNAQPRVSQIEFDRRLINFIVHSMSAISVIEHESFVKLFTGLNVNVMSRTTAVRRIAEMTKAKLTDIKNALQPIEFVCTTTDVWSSKRRSFLGMTCHWIDRENYQRKSAALACRRFSGTHSFDKLAELIEEIHTNFGIEPDKITATVSDNASNFIKAFKEFGIKIPNTIILNSLVLCDPHQDELEDLDNSTNAEELEEIMTLPLSIPSNDEGIDEPVDPHVVHLPKHHRCISHTINLVATTDLMKIVNKSHATRTRHTNIMNKCNQLWTKAGRPKSAEIIKEVLGHQLSYPGITRWNSQYDSISQILAEKQKLPYLCERLSIKQYCLKENELDYLSEYIKILKPLALALDMLQGENNLYFGFVIPTIASMRIKLEKLKNGNFKYFDSAVDELITAVSKRFQNFLSLNNEDAVLATVSHPTFKLRWLTVFKEIQIEQKTEAVKKLFIKAANEAATITDINPEESQSRDNPNELYDFFEFEENASCLTTSHGHSGQGELQVLQYLQDPRTDIKMLKKYPAIETLFLKYNTTLPSSAPVERMFSYATFINTPRRHALSDVNFENLVLMKANGS